MILPDSSAWIEYLRDTRGPVHLALLEQVESGARVATTDVVLMEVLAGARTRKLHEQMQSMLYACEYLRANTPSDFEAAAEIYRVCRRNGETIRKLSGCVIAAVAIRCGAALLHRDADFAAIARHVPLDLA